MGTQGFQAPEVLRLLDEAPETSEYTCAVDMWSLGCVLYVLKSRKLPFPGASLWGYCQGYFEIPDSPLRNTGMRTVGVQFLKELLAIEPSNRPSAASALQSPWILQHDIMNEDVKSDDGERHEPTTERTPSNMMSYGQSRKPKNDNYHSKQLRPDQTAVKPQDSTTSFLERSGTAGKPERNADNLESNKVFDLGSALQGMQYRPSNSQMGQRNSLESQHISRTGVPHLSPTTAHTQEDINYSFQVPRWELDTNVESQITATQLPQRSHSFRDFRKQQQTADMPWRARIEDIDNNVVYFDARGLQLKQRKHK